MKEIFKKYGDWVYRGILLAAVVAVGYLNQNYVTREEYKADKAAFNESIAAIKSATISTQHSLDLIVERMKKDAQQDEQIKDHELRLRALERGTR